MNGPACICCLLNSGRHEPQPRSSTGDTQVDGQVGCIEAAASSDDTSAAASVGSCAGVSGGGPGGGGGDGGGDGPDGSDSGIAGAFASGGEAPGLAALQRMGQGTLPFTGLPLWAVALVGLLTLLVGGALYRRRATLA